MLYIACNDEAEARAISSRELHARGGGSPGATARYLYAWRVDEATGRAVVLVADDDPPVTVSASPEPPAWCVLPGAA